MAELLPAEAIEARLGELEGWARDGDAITRKFDHGDFVGSVEFVNAIVPAAEEMNHHPDIDIRWRTLTFRCSTHSAGGITELDVRLAAGISALLQATQP